MKGVFYLTLPFYAKVFWNRLVVEAIMLLGITILATGFKGCTSLELSIKT
jgi:hypothetical protein